MLKERERFTKEARHPKGNVLPTFLFHYSFNVFSNHQTIGLSEWCIPPPMYGTAIYSK